jgi:hypothetical protein
MVFEVVQFVRRKMGASARFTQSIDTKQHSITSYKTAVLVLRAVMSNPSNVILLLWIDLEFCLRYEITVCPAPIPGQVYWMLRNCGCN